MKTPTQASAAATIFGAGKAFFWPTMMAVTSEQFPRGGALLLAIMGGAGNLAVAFILPLMGSWYDTRGAAAAFRFVGVLPVVLTLIFGGLLHGRRQPDHQRRRAIPNTRSKVVRTGRLRFRCKAASCSRSTAFSMAMAG